MRKDRTTPENIEELGPDEIFVFGSNTMGRHGRGAAKVARNKFGAEYGTGRWLTGRCFAIPTKDHEMKVIPLLAIARDVEFFIAFAKSRPGWKFLVTEIGCGLAGYEPKDVAPLFAGAIEVPNIHLPARFWDELERRMSFDGR